MEEIWKDIEGYEGLYQISSLGRVKSIGNQAGRAEKILKANTKVQTEYKYVILCKDKVQKTYTIHRLIAVAFIDNPENKGFVNFINRDRTDLRIENLEWCNRREISSRRYFGYLRDGDYQGVYLKKKVNRWISMITISGKSLHIGTFDTQEEARDARIAFMDKYRLKDKFFTV